MRSSGGFASRGIAWSRVIAAARIRTGRRTRPTTAYRLEERLNQEALSAQVQSARRRRRGAGAGENQVCKSAHWRGPCSPRRIDGESLRGGAIMRRRFGLSNGCRSRTKRIVARRFVTGIRVRMGGARGVRMRFDRDRCHCVSGGATQYGGCHLAARKQRRIKPEHYPGGHQSGARNSADRPQPCSVVPTCAFQR